MDQEVEIWKDIDFCVGVYQISSFGNVKSLYRVIKRQPKGDLTVNEKILKTFKAKTGGHLSVSLMVNGKLKTFKIHRLVANAFLDTPIDGFNEVDHIGCNKLNNNPSNLRWCNRSQNSAFAWSNGLHDRTRSIGDKNGNASISESEARNIKELLKTNKPTQVHKITGIKLNIIHKISSGKSWKHINI